AGSYPAAPRRATTPRIVSAAIAAGVWLVVVAPWAIRNGAVTGDPFFALQAHAEHLKDTRAFPGYTIYRGLEPESLATSLQERPEILARKTYRGLRFFLENLGSWLPWPLFALTAALVVRRRLQWRAQGRAGEPGRAQADPWWNDDAVVVAVTLGLFILQYAPFSHTLRHLAPLWPIAAWVVAQELAGALPVSDAGSRSAAVPMIAAGSAFVRQGLLPAATVGVVLLLVPPRLPGWETAAREATRLAPAVAAAVDRTSALPPGPVFTDNAAVLWWTGRAGVWSPEDPAVEQKLRELVPGLADAPRASLAGGPE
ncbi:MAG: hypothetical protein R6X25_13680, partial [Candidatus Krumholzibacteriia bacterium]